MRTVLSCAAVLGLGAWLSAEEPKPAPLDPTKLVGQWEAKGDPEKRRVVFAFEADGKLMVRITRKGEESSRAEGTYQIDGRKLILVLKIAGVDNERVVDVSKLTDGHLMGTGEKGRTVLLVRVTDK